MRGFGSGGNGFTPARIYRLGVEEVLCRLRRFGRANSWRRLVSTTFPYLASPYTTLTNLEIILMDETPP